MILCQRHVHYYSERGDLAMGRFGLMMKNKKCHGSETFDKVFWDGSQANLVRRGFLSRRAQDLSVRIGQGSKPHKLRCQGMILCQRHVHYYPERGDLAKGRFRLMMKNMKFHGSGTFDKPFWAFHKQMWRADAQC